MSDDDTQGGQLAKQEQEQQIENRKIEQLTRARAKRNGHKASFTRLATQYDTNTSHPQLMTDGIMRKIRAIVPGIEKARKAIYNLDLQIEQLLPTEEIETETDQQLTWSEKMDTLFLEATGLIHEYDTTKQLLTVREKEEAAAEQVLALAKIEATRPAAEVTTSRTSYSPVINQSNVRLPKLQPPTFSGNYADWTSFADQFRASVDGQTCTKVEKLAYLKQACKGSSQQLIKNLLITEENYEIAWEQLTDRYENKRAIVKTHLDNLLNYPPMKGDTGTGLRRLIESYKESLMALSIQGCDISTWDPILIHIIGAKIDPDSKKEWELQLTTNELPELRKLMKFLDVRAKALENVGPTKKWGDTAPQATRGQGYKAFAALTGVDPKCVVCKVQTHPIYQCTAFKRLSVDQRSEVVKEQRLCFNCLTPNHSYMSCPSNSVCKSCNKAHNTLLHREARSSYPALVDQGTTRVTPNGKSDVVQKNVFANNFQAGRGLANALLATCLVQVRDSTGKNVQARALLDSGSQANFMSCNKC